LGVAELCRAGKNYRKGWRDSCNTCGTRRCEIAKYAKVILGGSFGMKCSLTDKDFFRQNGYVHLPDHFGAQQVAALQDQHANLLDRARSILKETIEKGITLQEIARKRTQDLIVVPERDAPSVVCRFEYLTGFSEETKVCFEEHVTPVLDYLHEEPLVLFKDKCNEKNPQGGAFLPHQDYEAYHVFAPCYHATAMIAMDDMTLENGCL